jgi:hypothetical protein
MDRAVLDSYGWTDIRPTRERAGSNQHGTCNGKRAHDSAQR